MPKPRILILSFVIACSSPGLLSVLGPSPTLAAGTGAFTSHSVSAASFAVPANRICRRTNTAIERLPKDTSTGLALSDYAATLRLGVAESKALTRLSPPASEASRWVQFLQTQRHGLSISTGLLASLRTNNIRAINSGISELNRLNTEANKLANSLGLSICAENVSPRGR